MKLSDLLKKAATTIGAAGFATTAMVVEAPEAKAQFLDEFRQNLREVDRAIGIIEGARRGHVPNYGGTYNNGYGPGCQRDWYRNNGNKGGTYNVCKRQQPPREDGYGRLLPSAPRYYEQPRELCIARDRKGREFVVQCP